MKKSIGVFLIIISLAACNKGGEVYSDSKKHDEIQNNSIEVEKVVGVETSSENKKSEIEDKCYFMEKARLQNDTELEELYKKLEKLQDTSDETSKYPQSLHILKEITDDIGEIKGLIQYRSLQLNSEIK
jgi:flagellar motility protein MotE (MotC chaperone)